MWTIWDLFAGFAVMQSDYINTQKKCKITCQSLYLVKGLSTACFFSH